MERVKVDESDSEVVQIDGCTVILRYADRPNPGVMNELKELLFKQRTLPTKVPNFCNHGADMR